jgi:Spy/CpxP family protein refolding chaperone
MLAPRALPGTNTAAAAQLAPEQQVQVSPALQQMLADVQSLRSAGWSQIRGLLTPQQQALFDTLESRGTQVDEAELTNGAAGEADTTAASNAAEAGGESAEANGQPPGLGDPYQQLSLTDAQRTAIDQIMAGLHATMQALRDQAKAEFRAILTPEQAAALDQLTGQASASGTAQTGTRQASATGQLNDVLQLSGDQISQAEAIFAQLQADKRQLRAAAQDQILALLTDQQKAQLSAANVANEAAGGAVSAGAAPPSGAAPMESAGRPAEDAEHWSHIWQTLGQSVSSGVIPVDTLNQLNLSAAQATSIAGVVNDLESAIQTRVLQALADSRTAAGSTKPTSSGK